MSRPGSFFALGAMESERWQKLTDIVGECMDLPVAEREAFARARSGGDESLYREALAWLAGAAGGGAVSAAAGADGVGAAAGKGAAGGGGGVEAAATCGASARNCAISGPPARLTASRTINTPASAAISPVAATHS